MGIIIPHAKYIWHFRKDTVHANEDNLMKGMDIETEWQIYVVKVSEN